MSRSRPHVLFLFLDGVGLGNPGDHNPFSVRSLPGLERWTGGQPWTHQAESISTTGHVFHPIDATLGVEGLPQSGTGQASLFTGVNGAELAGRHFGPYPHSKTKSTLTERSIFRQVKMLDSNGSMDAAFANAYPDEFFKKREETGRWTVTTFCCINAKVHLRRFADWKKGHAITADLTGRAWKIQLGYDLEPITEPDAAGRLASLCSDYTLTVFEYYLTDKAGHSGRHRRARPILDSIDRFLEALYDRLDFSRDLFVLASEHGNLEDLSTTSHTRNPVPLIARGRAAGHLADAESIVDVTPGILEALS
jgi:hypothetical protein